MDSCVKRLALSREGDVCALAFALQPNSIALNGNGGVLASGMRGGATNGSGLTAVPVMAYYVRGEYSHREARWTPMASMVRARR